MAQGHKKPVKLGQIKIETNRLEQPLNSIISIIAFDVFFKAEMLKIVANEDNFAIRFARKTFIDLGWLTYF